VSDCWRTSFYSHCSAVEDSMLRRRCPYYGSPPPTAEEVAVKVASRGTAKSIGVKSLRLSIGSGRRPLTARGFSFIAFILWLLYTFLYVGALPIFINFLVDCDNLINSAVSKLEELNSTLREMDPFVVGSIIKALDGISGALRMIRLGNYMYMVVEILRFIIVLLILYFLYTGNRGEFDLALAFYILQRIGWLIAGSIVLSGIDTVLDLLLVLLVLENPFSYRVAEYLVEHVRSFSLLHRIWESANLVSAMVTIKSRSFGLFAISLLTAMIVIAFSWKALSEIEEEYEYERVYDTKRVKKRILLIITTLILMLIL